jgi:gluconolactonase
MIRKKLVLSTFFIVLILSINTFGAGKPKSVIAKGATVVKLCDGFSFTEGPAADKMGNVYFTDQPNNKILKWSVDSKLSVFSDNSGRANGLYFDKNGTLWACADMDNEIWSYDNEGNHTAYLTEGFEGKRFNAPNDLWIAPNGGIYFTDPYYKRPYWTHNGENRVETEQVYWLSPDKQKLIRVTTDLVKPNGIIGTTDGKRLYVADIKANKTWSYQIQADGSLTDKKLFTAMGSDGMTIDSKGNIYLTGKGVAVFNKKGEKIAHIPINEDWSANVCFGGKEFKTLYITASDSFYSIDMAVKGR